MATAPGHHQGPPAPDDGTSAAHIAFPQTFEDFKSDPRVSYSKLDDKHILEDDDGNEWEWQPASGEEAKAGRGRWVPSVST